MEKKPHELEEVIAELKMIREAISRSDNIIRFIDTRGALKGILLATGLVIALFSLLFYYLLESYGSFAAIPSGITATLFVLIGIIWCLIGFLKIRNFLKSARGISEDMTLHRLFDEIYTPRLLTIQLPYMLVITLAIIFICSKGLFLYLTPVLSVLFGLLLVSLSPLFYLKEFYFLSMWLIATGLMTLFTAAVIHPLAVLGLTFSVGFILAALLLYLDLPAVKR